MNLDTLKAITTVLVELFLIGLAIVSIVMMTKRGFDRKSVGYFVLAVGGLFIAYLTDNFDKISPSDWAQILLTTGLVMFGGFSAWAAVKTVNEMREQTNLSSRPVVIPRIKPSFFSRFEIYNAGNGPAINLDIAMLDRESRRLEGMDVTFLMAKESPLDFNPGLLDKYWGSACCLVCQYQGAFTKGKEPGWYKTTLLFDLEMTRPGGMPSVHIVSRGLEFSEISKREIYEVQQGSKPK